MRETVYVLTAFDADNMPLWSKDIGNAGAARRYAKRAVREDRDGNIERIRIDRWFSGYPGVPFAHYSKLIRTRPNSAKTYRVAVEIP